MYGSAMYVGYVKPNKATNSRQANSVNLCVRQTAEMLKAFTINWLRMC
jgi:hypothetical protein